MTSPLLTSFENGDSTFLDELVRVEDGAQLREFVELWKRDDRPWAHARQLEYAHSPLDHAGHEVVVKRLFKHAEATQDDEALAHWLVAFDRLVRRRRARVTVWEGRRVRTRDVLRTVKARTVSDPGRDDPYAIAPVDDRAQARDARLFSMGTRHYLRRRAWRVFRTLARLSGERYVTACRTALALYRDADLQRGEDLLDARSLVLIAFGEHPGLRLSGRRAHLVEGFALRELTPAPRWPELWRTDAGRAALLDLVGQAASHAVRVWAMELLERDHEPTLRRIPPTTLGAWLRHEDDHVRRLALRLLDGLEVSVNPTVQDWLTWCETSAPPLCAVLCQAFLRRTPLGALSLDDLVRCVAARPTWIAETALDALRARRLVTPEEYVALHALGTLRCAALAEPITSFAWELVPSPPAEMVETFLTNPLVEVRRAAIARLQAVPARHLEPRTIRRLGRSRCADVRRFLHRALLRQPEERRHVEDEHWTSIALDVERGSRLKPHALAEIARRVVGRPERADVLLPVLATCLRSPRRAERDAALAAFARVYTSLPGLQRAIEQLVPDVDWNVDVARRPT